MRHRALHAGLGLALALASATAAAQNDPFNRGFGGVGGPGGIGPGQPTQKKAEPKKPSDAPETHAASGASDTFAPGAEPSLPEEPLKLSDEVRQRVGTDFDLRNAETGRGDFTERDFYGLYYNEESNNYRFRTLFPLWLERTQPSLTDPTITDRASLYGGIYYNRRSATRSDDILFPLFWNLRERQNRTTVVGPFVNRRTPDESDDWLAPLWFFGSRKDGKYKIIPPLLTYMNHDQEGGFNLFGNVFCSWSGGPNCDVDTTDNLDFGVVPFYFDGHDGNGEYRLIPPLLHYHSRDLKWDTETNIWGPLYTKRTQERSYFHLLPLFWNISGENENHTTLFPLFHYGYDEKSSLFINPLYLSARGENGESTFASWLYARYRGRTELDMITPLLWLYRDPDIGLDQKLLFPFWYQRTSPRENDFVLFPFYGHFKRYGVSETTWITPFFQHSHGLRGWSTNLHPFIYVGQDGYDTHTVVAPFFWDFADRDSRATVGFPLYWRFKEPGRLSQLVGNVYYAEKRVKHGLDWEVHVFPLFSYGETPDGHWWNVLYGLAGYTRRGALTKVRSLWIPITLSEPEAGEAAP